MNCGQNCFFAAANTTKGFKSYFSRIFDPDKLKRMYIIKGGPGTGKSGMMRSIAAMAAERGLQTEAFACSSDPDSLDGILLPELGVAMIDGTSPHTVDPIYPGAVDGIVYTGAFWDVKALVSNKSEILRLIRESKRLYKRAYGYLSAVGEISSEIQRIAVKDLHEEKMRMQIKRLSRQLFTKNSDGQVQYRVLSSFNKNGITRISGNLSKAERIWFIRDQCYTSHVFLQQIANAASEAKQSFSYCPSCLFPHQPDALLFPDTKSAVVLEQGLNTKLYEEKEIHLIHMRRFTDKAFLKANAQKIRFGNKCVETLTEGAAEAFQEASDAHDRLEKIYIAAMDFHALDQLTRKVSKEIFSL